MNVALTISDVVKLNHPICRNDSQWLGQLRQWQAFLQGDLEYRKKPQLGFKFSDAVG
jgi:hypothetical protein